MKVNDIIDELQDVLYYLMSNEDDFERSEFTVNITDEGWEVTEVKSVENTFKRHE